MRENTVVQESAIPRRIALVLIAVFVCAITFAVGFVILKKSQMNAYRTDLVEVALPAGQYTVVPSGQGHTLVEAMNEYALRHKDRKVQSASFALKKHADGKTTTYIKFRYQPQ